MTLTHTTLNANPAKQIVAWAAELLASIVHNWESASSALALVLFAVLVYVTLQRVMGEDADPNFSYVKESDAGSTTILVSGVHYVMALVGVIAFLQWPAVVGNPLVLAALLGFVALHYFVEKRERSEL